MSYQVLARKWRPRLFRELVGQEHVLRALINALDQQRLHHAYLFTGTRGVGKTTIARILAKCLNCETGISSEPCGTCSSCQEISEGRFVDLIEVDAASRTKVEDTRELLDNVQYAPTRGRYKVYLIDEVHMLSGHSFNALLKTLEEPPEHVKFLLATTDPQKLPVTILSRCLQFNLKNLGQERIANYLQEVLTKESIEFDADALWLLGRAADGSMRDALSLTDQAIGFGDGAVRVAEVRNMLGSLDQHLVQGLLAALNSGEGVKVMAAVAHLAEHAPDFAAALQELQSLLHRIAVAQAVPDAVDNSRGDEADIKAMATEMAAEDIQLFYQIALQGRRDLPLAPDPRAGFEMCLLRMLAFRPHEAGAPAAKVPAVKVPAAKAVDSGGQQDSDSGREGEPPAKKPEAAAVAAAEIPSQLTPDHAPWEAPPPASAPSAEIDRGDRAGRAAEARRIIAAIESEGASSSSPVAGGESSRPSLGRQEGQPEPEVSPEAEAPPASTDEVKPLSLEALDAQSWLSSFESIPLGGALHNTASHCVLVGKQDNALFFVLDERQSTLYREDHQQRIADILSDFFGTAVTVRIQVGSTESETPAQHRRALDAQRQADAERRIQTDPHVQKLINHFAATIVDHSIRSREGGK